MTKCITYIECHKCENELALKEAHNSIILTMKWTCNRCREKINRVYEQDNDRIKDRYSKEMAKFTCYHCEETAVFSRYYCQKCMDDRAEELMKEAWSKDKEK